MSRYQKIQHTPLNFGKHSVIYLTMCMTNHHFQHVSKLFIIKDSEYHLQPQSQAVWNKSYQVDQYSFPNDNLKASGKETQDHCCYEVRYEENKWSDFRFSTVPKQAFHVVLLIQRFTPVTHCEWEGQASYNGYEQEQIAGSFLRMKHSSEASMDGKIFGVSPCNTIVPTTKEEEGLTINPQQ